MTSQRTVSPTTIIKDNWWLQAPELVSEIPKRSSNQVASACYQFGDSFLDIDSDYHPVLEELQQMYGECSVSTSKAISGVRVKCSVRFIVIDTLQLTLVTFHGLNLPELTNLALNLLIHYFGTRNVQYSVNKLLVPGWDIVSSTAHLSDPFMAIRGTSSFIDLLQSPPRYLVNYIVSTVLSLQKDALFIHAASVGIHEAGVLLNGSSGAGKTTLAMTLASRGHAFLSESVSCIRINSCELLPFRRVARIRPGIRAQVVDNLLKIGSYEPQIIDDGTMRIQVPVGELFPDSVACPLRLRSAFFLRGFAAQPVVESFTPTLKDIEILKPLSYQILAGSSCWGVSPERRLMKFLSLINLLSKVPCYFIDVGTPEETADLIEKTLEDL